MSLHTYLYAAPVHTKMSDTPFMFGGVCVQVSDEEYCLCPVEESLSLADEVPQRVHLLYGHLRTLLQQRAYYIHVRCSLVPLLLLCFCSVLHFALLQCTCYLLLSFLCSRFYSFYWQSLCLSVVVLCTFSSL